MHCDYPPDQGGQVGLCLLLSAYVGQVIIFNTSQNAFFKKILQIMTSKSKFIL